jgi:hypothetical protein
MISATRCGVLLAVLLLAPPALAGSAPFDLAGPDLQVTVTRAGHTLPIAQTPNLAEGDILSIKADLSKTQSVRYLLVAGFLRGVTNPPTDKWFFESQTWNPKDKTGLTLTVPQGAQQILLFLAPQTGGDFKTLVNTVRGRPGAFVRASQDINQASLDHGRLMAFLAAIQAINQKDPGRLKTVSPILARSLSVKLDSACLTKTADVQAACLTQGQDSLVLNDGHSTSIVQALSSGYSAELIQQLSATPQAGGGYFSPYVASVLDIAHIMDSFHTAQYQYIPALGTMADARLSLLLNAPPSFHNPKSVLVISMPAVEPAQPPPLHAIDPDGAACLQQPGLVLPVEGAPLVFSTAYAHDLVLRLTTQAGAAMDLPVRADAQMGGLVVDASNLDAAALGDTVEGVLQGAWGFDPYTGPKFRLHNARPQTWRVASEDQQGLTAGRDNRVRLQAQASGCVQSVTLKSASGSPLPVEWKATGPDALTVTLPLKDASPGPVTVLIQSYGAKDPDAVTLTVYAPTSRLEAFTLHAGDAVGLLKGANLDQVASLELDGVVFDPAPPTPGEPRESAADVILAAVDAQAAAKLKGGQSAKARVKLKDGRTVALPVTIAPARPAVGLIGKDVQPASSDSRLKIALGNPDQLPHDAKITFSIRAQGTTAFVGMETVEVAAGAGGFSATATAANGGFVLQNAQVGLVMLDLGKAFGSSAFGPLRFRVINQDGASDWQPLGVLVRLPVLHDLNCSASGAAVCQMSGSNLFLIDSVSADRGFGDAVQVPAGFPGNTLQVPKPTGGRLYVKLSDDPGVVNTVNVAGSHPAAGAHAH